MHEQRDAADRVWASIIRARGICERCGSRTGLQAAHIRRRGYQATRCDLDNGWCLCWRCHPDPVDTDVTEFDALVARTIGAKRYADLVKRSKAGEGHRYRPEHWAAIRADLERRLPRSAR